MGDIVEALLNVQKEIQNPKMTGDNPFTKSKYAPLPDILNQVRPLLTEQGIVCIQNTGSCSDGSLFVQTKLLYSNGNGQEVIESDKLILSPDSGKMKSDIQGVGSAITYGRRYQIMALLNIAGEGEDDDGSSASKTPKGNDAKETPNNRQNNTTKAPKTSKTGKKSKTSKTSKTSRASDEEAVSDILGDVQEGTFQEKPKPSPAKKTQKSPEVETHDMTSIDTSKIKGINKELDIWINTVEDIGANRDEVISQCQDLLGDSKISKAEVDKVKKVLGVQT